MKEHLYKLMIAFMAAWTIAGVFEEPHRQAIVYSICCTMSYGIYLGIHSLIYKKAKSVIFGELP